MSASQNPFFVISLPRSRSAWMSTFLSYQGRRVGHDLIVRTESVREFAETMACHVGTCETGAVVGWKLLRSMWPKSKILVIKRPVAEIVASCQAKGLKVDTNVLLERQVMLEMLSASPGVFTVDFAALDYVENCKWIFEWLLETEFDAQWWSELRNKNIQIDFAKRMAELQSGFARIANLMDEVQMETRKLGSAKCLGLN